MSKTYNLDLDFHENGKLKSVKTIYDSEYGSLSDILGEKTITEIIRLIEVNTKEIQDADK